MPLLGSIDAIRRASRVNDVVCSDVGPHVAIGNGLWGPTRLS
jgi:hypothetical protein